jgi:hypothetical protein
MRQATFSDAEFANKKKQTRRDRFLAEIEAATSSPELVAALLPYYPKEKGRGRPPLGRGRMLRMYIAQQCFGLSNEGTEGAIYDSAQEKSTGSRQGKAGANEGHCARQGRAREVPVQASQDALSGTGQEQCSTVHPVRLRQSGAGAQVLGGTPKLRSERGKRPGYAQKLG